jgi:methylated-DNA-protein-cysteine methyltransferase-like protein
MSPSPNYARIKAEILEVMRAVPPGRLVTFAEIGSFLDVMPRHVAYILSQLNTEESVSIPWHRAVGKKGELKPYQAALLKKEGILIDSAGNVANLSDVTIPVTAFLHKQR